MISDLTTIGLKNLNHTNYINRIVNLFHEDESYSYQTCCQLVLTGTAKQRSEKRRIKVQYEYQCECCGRFYTSKPWQYTWGLCESCYKREYVDNIRYDERSKPKWRFGPVNNTQRILDLWNRCY